MNLARRHPKPANEPISHLLAKTIVRSYSELTSGSHVVYRATKQQESAPQAPAESAVQHTSENYIPCIRILCRPDMQPTNRYPKHLRSQHAVYDQTCQRILRCFRSAEQQTNLKQPHSQHICSTGVPYVLPQPASSSNIS